MLNKISGNGDGAQRGGFAGCVWAINTDDQRQTLIGYSLRIPKQAKSGAFAGTRKSISCLSATEKKFSMVMLCIIFAMFAYFMSKGNLKYDINDNLTTSIT